MLCDQVAMRHKHDRREHGRSISDRRRRRRDRRRATTRSVLMAAATLAAATPLHAKTGVKPLVLASVSDFRTIPAEKVYEAFIQEAAETHGLDAALIRAVMRAESAFNPRVVSSAGAQGLMQLMPALAIEMGVQDPFDARENTMGGARYLKQLLTLHRGNVPLTLASYNAGPGAVKRYRNQIPPFKETLNYVKKIMGFLKERNKRGLPVSAASLSNLIASEPAKPVSGGLGHFPASSSPIRRSIETIDGRTVPKYSNAPAAPARKPSL